MFTALGVSEWLEGAQGLRREGQMQSMENKPAGWYRNSDDRRQHGYWDGFAWDQPPEDDSTASTNDLGVIDEPDQPGAVAAPED